MRLLGFERVKLDPGESQEVAITADPRLLARYDGDAGRWHIAEGKYRIALGKAAEDLVDTMEVTLTERSFGS
jgi:beta-glucosidase